MAEQNWSHEKYIICQTVAEKAAVILNVTLRRNAVTFVRRVFFPFG